MYFLSKSRNIDKHCFSYASMSVFYSLGEGCWHCEFHHFLRADFCENKDNIETTTITAITRTIHTMEDNKDINSPGDDAKPFTSVCRAKKTFQMNRKLMQWCLKCAALLFLAVKSHSYILELGKWHLAKPNRMNYSNQVVIKAQIKITKR